MCGKRDTRGASLRRAPFLFAANPVFASGRWLPRRFRVPVVPVSGTSSRDREGSSIRARRDTLRRTSLKSPWPHADRSKGRCGNRTCTVRPKESSRVVASVSRSGGAWDRDVVWPSRPPDLLSARPDAIALLKIRKPRRFARPRRPLCHPAVTSLPTVGEFPTRLCFLSFSYRTIRMFTADGSFAMQGSIVVQGIPNLCRSASLKPVFS